MKRIVLFSDVHGNIVGLRTILDAVSKLKNVSHIIACGDFFGYDGGNDDVFEICDEFNVIMLRGDHEEYMMKIEAGLNHEIPHPVISETHKWLQSHLNKKNFNRLMNLDVNISIKINENYSLLACHSGPTGIRSRTCAADVPLEILRKTYGKLDENFIVYGHHHEPHVIHVDDKILINCASVGMRKADNISNYTIIEYDDEQFTIAQNKLRYDKIEAERLAEERLIPRIIL